MLNQQGDVIRIIDKSGTAVAEYSYDAWGNLLVDEDDLTDIGHVNPIRYRGYYYDTETGFYYLQSRYYDPSIGRFINADSFASTGQGFIGYNMFGYCNNNPVMNCDPTGKIGIMAILSGIGIFAVILSIPSSEHQQPTEPQLESARKASDRAEVTMRTDDAGQPYTVDIHIDMKDTIASVDNIARDYYYECLYDRTVEMANEYNIPADNLMTIGHIRWEFQVHELGYWLGIENTFITDLNVEETLWTMIKRFIG